LKLSQGRKETLQKLKRLEQTAAVERLSEAGKILETEKNTLAGIERDLAREYEIDTITRPGSIFLADAIESGYLDNCRHKESLRKLEAAVAAAIERVREAGDCLEAAQDATARATRALDLLGK
jgi:hypothetical protein